MEIVNDFQTSVRRALSEIDPHYEQYDALVICGTHAPHDTEEMIQKIKEARVSFRPFLGICFGHQLACIEWARNIMRIEDATSQEFGEGTFVVKKRPSLKVGLHDGETWWSNYEVIGKVEKDFLDYKPLTMITSAFHPEYQSSKDRPHSLLVSFIESCRVYKRMPQ